MLPSTDGVVVCTGCGKDLATRFGGSTSRYDKGMFGIRIIRLHTFNEALSELNVLRRDGRGSPSPADWGAGLAVAVYWTGVPISRCRP